VSRIYTRMAIFWLVTGDQVVEFCARLTTTGAFIGVVDGMCVCVYT
jgi:hypothetical protein